MQENLILEGFPESSGSKSYEKKESKFLLGPLNWNHESGSLRHQVLGGRGYSRLLPFSKRMSTAQSEEQPGSSVLRNPRTVGLVLERKIIRFCYR